MATERRYLAGFGGFVRGELLHWTGWRGLVRVVAWTALVNAFLYRSITSDFDPWFSLESADEIVDWVFFFAMFLAMLLTVGPVVAERRRGTAAWVVSKPVSRGTYVLGKITALVIGVTVGGVLIPGLVAYAWLPHVDPHRGFSVPLPGLGRFLAALLVVALLATFIIALTAMLGTLLKRQAPVTGIVLIVIVFMFGSPLGQSWSKWLPGALTNWERGGGELTGIAEFAMGGRLDPIEPLVVAAVAIAAFTAVALLAFRRSEL
jgi:ABC-2 type transport system permease protein